MISKAKVLNFNTASLLWSTQYYMYSVADPAKGPGEHGHPLLLDQT